MIDREIRTLQQRSPDRVIAERRGISLRSVQNRLQQIYDKLGVYDAERGAEVFNLRMRAVSLALLRRLLNRGGLEQAETGLQARIAGPR